ncbi:MAG TPA: hypothetical protein DGT21_12065 [Armatimonadetes bacterium]|jgi:hypothetical protein|nr:hypothetical protein [Armatimonadota bacterium]
MRVHGAVLPVVSLVALVATATAQPTVIQGEDFDCDGQTWRGAEQSSRYAPDSGLKHLTGATGGQGVATAQVDIVEAGQYTIWVRHTVMAGEAGSWTRGPFRLAVKQADVELAVAELDVQPPEVTPGQIHRYDWASFPAELPAGPVTLELSKLDPINCSGWTRQIDCIVLTTDPGYTPDVSDFQPKVWLRVRLGDTPCPPIYIHCFCDHFRAPWYKHFSLSKSGYEERVAPSGGTKTYLSPGEATPWCDVTRAIHEDTGARMELRGAEKYSYTEWLPALDATFDFATAPDDAAIVKSFRKQGEGAGLSIIVPGVLAPESADRLKADYEYCAENLRLADSLPGISFGKRPERFPFFISLGLKDGLYSPDLRRDEYSVAAKLGFNGAYDQIDPLLASLGFSHTRGGAGAWFMTDRCYLQPETERIRANLIANGAQWADRPPGFVSIMDEPAANPLSHLCGCEACQGGFRAWLRDDLEVPLTDLGVDDWGQVKPVDAAAKATAPALYYYSQRFRAKAFADFLRLETDMMAELWAGAPRSTANFSDYTVYNAGMYEGGADYFHIFRTKALSMAWSEDWSNISSTYQCCGYNVELLRSAAKYHRQPIGMYVITSYGRKPLDVKLKAYSSLGRDARTLWSFAYGPHYANHEPNWYLNTEMYGPIRELTHEIGGAEDLLMDARRIPSEVALLYSTTSDIWTAFANSLYGHERMHTYLALTHAQVPVDILSEEDIVEGSLARYKALYVFGPNLLSAAAEPIAGWVKAGGVLYMAAGSAVADEYNRPARPLDDALGLTRGDVTEHEVRLWPGRYLQQLKSVGTVTLGDAAADVVALRQALPVDGTADAITTARFDDGSPAACTVPAGKGRVYVSGFAPGLSYIRKALLARDAAGTPAPDLEDPIEFNTLGSFANLRPQDVSYNPWEYPEAEREFVLEPVRAAGVRKPVLLSHRLIESFYMEGPDGAVVTLANYSLRPIGSLDVTIRCSRRPSRVGSVRAGAVEARIDGTLVHLSLPLADTDMIKLYW